MGFNDDQYIVDFFKGGWEAEYCCLKVIDLYSQGCDVINVRLLACHICNINILIYLQVE